MVQLDFNLGVKKPPPPDANSTETPCQNTTEKEKNPQEFDDPMQKPYEHFDRTDMQEFEECLGMDWTFINKIGNAQFIFAMVGSGCLMMSMSFTGFNFLRFTSSAWSTYLLCTAYIAIRAGRWRSYSHVVAYTGMVCFQTVVYMSSLCWLVYSLYALDYHYHISMHNVSTSFEDRIPRLALIVIVIEVVSLMGTVFTGVFGMIACCRGFGKLLDRQERMILEQRYAAPQPKITLHPIV